MSHPALQRKPWPMKWILLAIVAFIVIYTYLTLHFRKPGRSYEPYHDMAQRANTGRLLAARFQRIELPIQRPADLTPGANTALPAPGGLPEDLRSAIVLPPTLPTEVVGAHAAASTSAGADYPVQFRCIAPDDKLHLVGVDVYVKGEDVVITPRFERLAGGLESRTRDVFATFSVPAGTLRPGTYRVALVGGRVSKAWTLAVR